MKFLNASMKMGMLIKRKHCKYHQSRKTFRAASTKLTFLVPNSSFHNLYLSFVLDRNYLLECCIDFFKYKTQHAFLTYADCMRDFIPGLAAFRVYRMTGNSEWLKKAGKCTEEIRVLNQKGSKWNFEHKMKLMEAEEHFSSGDCAKAKESYLEAISLARAHKFPNDEALSCELVARFFSDLGDMKSSKEYFLLAHKKYSDWGACAKAAYLMTVIEAKFDQSTSVNQARQYESGVTCKTNSLM